MCFSGEQRGKGRAGPVSFDSLSKCDNPRFARYRRRVRKRIQCSCLFKPSSTPKMHRYFNSDDWGLKEWRVHWEHADRASAALKNVTFPPSPPPIPLDHFLTVAATPWIILFAFTVSLMWRGDDGGIKEVLDKLKRRRITYSFPPDNRVFGIWLVIYVYTCVSLVLQLVYVFNNEDHLASESDVFIAFAWLLTIAWYRTFKSERFVLAALSLILAASVSILACVYDGSWRRAYDYPVRLAFVSTPYSLFAGWLVVAATLSVAIAVSYYVAWAKDRRTGRRLFANSADGDDGDDELSPARSSSRSGDEPADSTVPLFLSFCISVAAILLPNPVIAIAAFVGVLGIANVNRTWKNAFAVLLSASSAIVASVLVFA